jgi:hypothetical protein
VVQVLSEICTDDQAQVPVSHLANAALDNVWLSTNGIVRIATAVAAAITELRWLQAVPPELDAEARDLAQRLFDVAKRKVSTSSLSQQSLYWCHLARHMSLNGEERKAIRLLDQARINFSQHPTQRDIRYQMEAMLLHAFQQGISHTRDSVLQNGNHPVFARMDAVRPKTGVINEKILRQLFLLVGQFCGNLEATQEWQSQPKPDSSDAAWIKGKWAL